MQGAGVLAKVTVALPLASVPKSNYFNAGKSRATSVARPARSTHSDPGAHPLGARPVGRNLLMLATPPGMPDADQPARPAASV